jgi:hypothetical protein
MYSYQGAADCILPDGTALPVQVSLRSEPGLLDGLKGTATGGGVTFLKLAGAEVKLRLPDGRSRMFQVTDAPFTSGHGGRLDLVSHREWLS